MKKLVFFIGLLSYFIVDAQDDLTHLVQVDRGNGVDDNEYDDYSQTINFFSKGSSFILSFNEEVFVSEIEIFTDDTDYIKIHYGDGWRNIGPGTSDISEYLRSINFSVQFSSTVVSEENLTQMSIRVLGREIEPITDVITSNNGNIGIGTTDAQSKLHLSVDSGDNELLIETDIDNSNEMDNPFITFSQDGGFVKGFIGLVGDPNTAPQIEKYGRTFQDDQGVWHDRSDYVGTKNNYLLVGMNQKQGVQLGSYGEVRMTVHQNGNVGIGTNEPTSKLDVKGDAHIGDLESRSKLKISSNEWPEIRFETPLSSEKIRLGVAHTDHTGYGVKEGDFYVYTADASNMPVIVRKEGDVSLALNSGNVGIGIAEANEKLEVNGNIRTKEIIVEASPWPDYVFESEYDLKPLDEVSSFIEENGHLPNMPSAQEVEKEGVAVGEMNAKLLEKIEQLTLYILDLQEQIDELKKE